MTILGITLLLQISAIPTMLIYLLIVCLALAAVYYVITKFAPEPIRGYAIGIVVVLAVIVLIWCLLALVGQSPRLNR